MDEKKTKFRRKTPKHGVTKTHKNKTKYDRKSSKKKLNDPKSLLDEIS